VIGGGRGTWWEQTHLRRAVDAIRADGFYKAERVIESPQSSQM
jgi:hypothetical protein